MITNIRYLSIVLVAELLVAACRGDGLMYGCAKSPATNGFFVIVAGGYGPANPKLGYTPTVKDPIIPSFRTTGSNTLQGYLMGKPKDFCRIKLEDAKGRQIAKTYLGSQYGENYDGTYNLKESRDLSRIYIVAGDLSQYLREESAAWVMPSTKDLFKVRKPGTYKLTMEFKFYLQVSTNREVVRLPPVEWQVEAYEE
jgi:hypothetical protein